MGKPLEDDLMDVDINTLIQKAISSKNIVFEISPDKKSLTMKVWTVKFKCNSEKCSHLHVIFFTNPFLAGEKIEELKERYGLEIALGPEDEPTNPKEYCISPAALFVCKVA